MYYYYEHILHIEYAHRTGPEIIMPSDISGALDSAFAVGVSHLLAYSALVTSYTVIFETVLSLWM